MQMTILGGPKPLHEASLLLNFEYEVTFGSFWVFERCQNLCRLRNWTDIWFLLFFLYFVDGTSLYKFLVITNLTHFSCIYLFPVSTCFERHSAHHQGSKYINTSPGMINMCKWLLATPVGREIPTGIPSNHLHRLIIPDDVLIQFDLLMMGAVTLETCRDMKCISSSSCSWRVRLVSFPRSSKWSWSLHLFFGRPMFLRPFGLYFSACFGILFLSILCTCYSHFLRYCFISFTMFCPGDSKHYS